MRAAKTTGIVLWVLALLVWVGGCGPEAAVVEHASEPCTDCVAFTPAGLLEFASAPTLPSVGGTLVAAPLTGGHAFVDRSARHEILVFDRDGGHRAKIGELGDGPGEFDAIWALSFDSGDTLWVASQRGARLDIFAPDLEHVRSLRPEAAVTAMAAVPGGLAVAAADGLEGQVGVMDSEGRIDVLWRDSVPRGSGYPSGVTDLAASPDGTIWFAEEHAYRVWRIDRDGGVVQVLGATPSWFRAEYPREVMAEFPGISDRGGTIMDVTADTRAGLLWVTSAIPASDVTVAELRPLFERPQTLRDDIVAALLEYVVEAYDLESGERVGVGRGDPQISYRSPVKYLPAGPEQVEVIEPTLRPAGEAGVDSPVRGR